MEDDQIYEQFRQEREGMSADLDARFMEVRRQEEAERARYAYEVRLTVIEIQRRHRVLQQADRMLSIRRMGTSTC